MNPIEQVVGARSPVADIVERTRKAAYSAAFSSNLVVSALDALALADEITTLRTQLAEAREALERMPMPERFEMWKRDAGKHLEGAERALFELDIQDAADTTRSTMERIKEEPK